LSFLLGEISEPLPRYPPAPFPVPIIQMTGTLKLFHGNSSNSNLKRVNIPIIPVPIQECGQNLGLKLIILLEENNFYDLSRLVCSGIR
jgi:hypothetical protein